VFPGKVPLFLEIPEFSYNTQGRIGGRMPPSKNELDPYIRFDRIPTCDRQTDTADTRP